MQCELEAVHVHTHLLCGEIYQAQLCMSADVAPPFLINTIAVDTALQLMST